VLVGFMGAGKTTLGPILAERLGRSFVSVDEIVERTAGSRPVASLRSASSRNGPRSTWSRGGRLL